MEKILVKEPTESLAAHLVEYQWFVIVGSVVLHDVKDGRVLEDIHHLDPVEVDHDAAAGSTGNVLHLVGLESRLEMNNFN